MSHLHVPDGLLNIYWVAASMLASLGLVLLFVRKVTSRQEGAKEVGRLSFGIAFLLVAMSIPVAFLPVHLNMAAFLGILLGGPLAYLAAFCASIMLALLGHGGFTTIGLNALVLGSEGFLASFLFRHLGRRWKVPWATAISVVLTLCLTVTGSVLLLRLAGGEALALEMWQQEHNHSHAHADCGHFHLPGALLSAVPIFTFGIGLEAVVCFFLASFLVKSRPGLLKGPQE